MKNTVPPAELSKIQLLTFEVDPLTWSVFYNILHEPLPNNPQLWYIHTRDSHVRTLPYATNHPAVVRSSGPASFAQKSEGPPLLLCDTSFFEHAESRVRITATVLQTLGLGQQPLFRGTIVVIHDENSLMKLTGFGRYRRIPSRAYEVIRLLSVCKGRTVCKRPTVRVFPLPSLLPRFQSFRWFGSIFSKTGGRNDCVRNLKDAPNLDLEGQGRSWEGDGYRRNSFEGESKASV